MSVRSTSLPTPNTVGSTAVAPRPRDGHGGRAGTPGAVRWQQALQSKWQRKIDEVIVLSRARGGLSSDADQDRAVTEVGRSRRLGARIDAALDEVAAIEEALTRVDDGSYGTCAGCDRRMAAEWLTETPETQYCPDCSLRLLSWQPKATRQERPQAQRPAAACRL
jgi:DnaK suppressor protein